MFENLHLFSYMGNQSSQEVQKDIDYQIMKEKYHLQVPHEDYYINGKNLYLLNYPLSDEQRANLMYLQSFSYMEVGAKYYTKRQNYPSYLMLYTYKGQGVVFYQGKEKILHVGEGILIDCRKPHEYRTDGNLWHQCSLHFFGGNSDFLCHELIDPQNPVFHCSDHASFQHKLEQLLLTQKSADSKRDFLFHFYLENLLLFIVSCMRTNESMGTVPENIRLLRSYLEQHYTSNMSLDEMAAFAGFSKYHLIRQFKLYTSFTPKEYVTHLRLNHACLLLQNTDIPCYKIGEIVGFPGEANFIQIFKKYKRKTPGDFRNEYRTNIH